MKFALPVLNFIIYILFHVYGEELDESESGTFLFLSDNEEFFEDKAELVGKGKGPRPPCQDETLMKFLSSLQVINPESVIALATKNKLEKCCVNISRTIDEMKTYLKSCELRPEQDTFIRLLKCVTVLHKKLCTNDPYHKSFMQYKKCFSTLQSEFDSCNGPADWSDSSNIKKVCKAFQEITDCYYIKTSVLCGNQAADVFKELVVAVIDSVVTVSKRDSNVPCD
ncbi:hypothetical protein J6590_061284 [Homalodisca vitripennis]|nr:hypothetical protein J6590_061284 [Homalodisca vitripennis]